MTVRIAKHRRTGLHYFIRVVKDDPEDLDIGAMVKYFAEDYLCTPESDFFNLVSIAKSHKQLVAALDDDSLVASGYKTLLSQATDSPLQPPRVMDAEECLAALLDDFEPVDARLLAREMFLASPRDLRANHSARSPAAVVSAYEGDFGKELRNPDRSCYVVAEPVQNWMTFRNLVTICASLLANIRELRDDQEDRTLEAAGFYLPEGGAYDPPAFVIPIKYYASGTATQSSEDEGGLDELADRSRDGLLRLFLEASGSSQEGRVPAGADSAPAAWLHDEELGVFLSAPREGVREQRPSIIRRSRGAGSEQGGRDRNLYLCVR